MNQRWRRHRTTYRPAGGVIVPSEYDIAAITGDLQPKAFLKEHHYLGSSYPAARFRYGLYRRGNLVGVAVFSHPCNDAVLTNVFHCPPLLAVELGRFVLLDEIPGNGETFFLRRCFEQLKREGLVGVVSFSDPLPRRTADGTVAFRGHIGTIYQAFNGSYLGLSTARTLRLLPDGTVLSDRSLQKIRRHERGWKYASSILERFGADAHTGNDPGGWLAHWLPKLTRTVRHPGNHKYAWALNRAAAESMPSGLPYPKFQPLFF